jgi:hypothetical protein
VFTPSATSCSLSSFRFPCGDNLTELPLDTALQIIARVGTLYNGLQQQDQKKLLRQMVERVVVSHEGIVRLELRAPFAYLKDLIDEVRTMSGRSRVSRA